MYKLLKRAWIRVVRVALMPDYVMGRESVRPSAHAFQEVEQCRDHEWVYDEPRLRERPHTSHTS